MRTLLALLLALLPAAAVEPPTVSVSLNSGAPRMAPGAPWIAVTTVLLEVDPEAPAPLEDEAPPALEFVVTNEQGEAVAADWLRRELEPAQELYGFREERLIWTVKPEVTQALPEGRYTLIVRRGDAQAPPVEFELKADEPGDRLLLSQWEELEGRPDAAMAQVDAELVEHPESVPALVRKAELHERAGHIDEAVAAMEQAMRASNSDGSEPSQLQHRYLELMAIWGQ